MKKSKNIVKNVSKKIKKDEDLIKAYETILKKCKDN
jgi:hypothetical protein